MQPIDRTRSRARDPLAFLAGGGEMGARIRAFDWSSSPLGPPERWLHGLKTAVRILLTSRQPLWLGWGEELTYLYNDPYKSILGGKHPRMLGRPAAAVWPEIWDVIAPSLSTAIEGDEGTHLESQLLVLERHGYPEETYYSFSYSPLPNDDGTVGGVLCASVDDTRRVIGERQLTLLRDLVAETANARGWREACERSGVALGSNPRDLPWALVYVTEPGGDELALAAARGIDPEHRVARPAAWPFEEVLASSEGVVLEDLSAAAGDGLPTGAWEVPPRAAALVPIAADAVGRAGVLVAGLNPYRLFDAGYRDFLVLVASEISAAIAGAQVYEERRRAEAGRAETDRAETPSTDADDGSWIPARVAIQVEMARVYREAMAALRESEERYRQIFEAARVSIWEEDFSTVKAAVDALEAGGVTDFRAYLAEHPEFVREAIGMVRIVDVNEATLQMFGAESKSELLDSLHKIFVPETGEVFAEELVAIAEGRPFVEAESTVRTLAGERLEVLVTLAFPPEDRELRRVLVTLVDITERKRAEEALKEADRRKDEFLATLAHELRNPLAPMRNSLEIMRLAEGDPQAGERARATIERQLNQMVRLVDDLLDLSRITRDKIEFRMEPVTLREIVESAVETSRPLIDASRHELRIRLPDEPVWLEADLTRMAQVVSNLLNNAANYTPRGGHVWLEAEAGDGEVAIRVRDDGIGISAEALPHVFEMFTQADEEGSHDGLGIGLTLVKGLVEVHGGRVEVRSGGRGQGSEFTVRLPRIEGGRPAAAAKAEGSRRPDGGLASRRVLVVDDNRDSADSLGMLLEMSGCEVRTVHDGPAALVEVRGFRPEVVVLDVGMPGMNGYEVARRLRAEPELDGVVLVALTGWGQDEDRRRAREAGFDHHLTKPADLGVLERVLAASAAREQR